jgi:hypothetical protein
VVATSILQSGLGASHIGLPRQAGAKSLPGLHPQARACDQVVRTTDRAPHGRVPHGVYLIGVHLRSVYLINVHLTGVHLMGVYLTGVHLIKRASYGRAACISRECTS